MLNKLKNLICGAVALEKHKWSCRLELQKHRDLIERDLTRQCLDIAKKELREIVARGESKTDFDIATRALKKIEHFEQGAINKRKNRDKGLERGFIF